MLFLHWEWRWTKAFPLLFYGDLRGLKGCKEDFSVLIRVEGGVFDGDSMAGLHAEEGVQAKGLIDLLLEAGGGELDNVDHCCAMKWVFLMLE